MPVGVDFRFWESIWDSGRQCLTSGRRFLISASRFWYLEIHLKSLEIVFILLGVVLGFEELNFLPWGVDVRSRFFALKVDLVPLRLDLRRSEYILSL